MLIVRGLNKKFPIQNNKEYLDDILHEVEDFT